MTSREESRVSQRSDERREGPSAATADPPLVALVGLQAGTPSPQTGFPWCPVDVGAGAGDSGALRLGSTVITVTAGEGSGSGCPNDEHHADPVVGDVPLPGCSPATCGHGSTRDARQIRLRSIDGHLESWREDRARDHERKAAISDVETTRTWHLRRAGGIRRRLQQRVGDCGELVAAIVSCAGCGVVHQVRDTCRVHQACPSCSTRRAGKVRKRLQRALWKHASRLRVEWRAAGAVRSLRPHLTMLTFTMKHSGSLQQDVEAFTEAWRRFRASLRKVLHKSGFCTDAPPFARVLECTPGSLGDGHVHMHVAIFLPAWIDYSVSRAGGLQRLWVKASKGAAIPGRGLQIDRAERRGASTSADELAGYVSKGSALALYIAKGSQLVDESTEYDDGAELAAEWFKASYARRVVQGSGRFWEIELAETPCCTAPYVVHAVGKRAREILGAGVGAELIGARSPPAPS